MHIFSKKSVTDVQKEKVGNTRRDILKTAALGVVGTAAVGAGMIANMNMAKGVKAEEAARKEEIAEQTYYRWRQKYGGMQPARWPSNLRLSRKRMLD